MMLIDVYLLPWPRRGSTSLQRRLMQLASNRKAHRLLLVGGAVTAYAQLRSLLAGDHLVRIYRKVNVCLALCDVNCTRLEMCIDISLGVNLLLLSPKRLYA